MTTLSQAVQEAIQKDLPGIAANELSTFIKNAENTARELERARSEVSAKADRIERMEATLAVHVELAKREQEVTKREDDIIAKDLALSKREAQLDAKIAQAELGGVKETMNAFLRNVTVRQTIIADVSKPVDGVPGSQYNSGGPGFLARSPNPDTTTKIEEQE